MRAKRDKTSEAARKARYKDKLPEYQRRYREKNKAAIKLRRAAAYQKNKPRVAEKNRAQRLRTSFGITPEQYQDVSDIQGGVCAICGGPEIPGRNLAVDHCHDTGAIRGLLCLRCNTGLGQFRDSPDLLDRAYAYVFGHKHFTPQEKTRWP